MLIDKVNKLLRSWNVDPEVYPIVAITTLSGVYGTWVAVRKYLEVKHTPSII